MSLSTQNGREPRNAGVRGYDITQSQTIYLPGVRRFYLKDGNLVEHQHFIARNNILRKLISEKKYKAVILAGSFPSYFNGDGLRDGTSSSSNQAFKSSFEVAIRDIISAGSIPVIIDDNPSLIGVEHDCTLNNLRFNRDTECNFPAAKYNEATKNWHSYLDQIRVIFPEAVTIRPDQIICNEKCQSDIDGIPLYRDSGHLNKVGSELIGDKYIKRFGNPLGFMR